MNVNVWLIVTCHNANFLYDCVSRFYMTCDVCITATSLIAITALTQVNLSWYICVNFLGMAKIKTFCLPSIGLHYIEQIQGSVFIPSNSKSQTCLHWLFPIFQFAVWTRAANTAPQASVEPQAVSDARMNSPPNFCVSKIRRKTYG